MVRASKVAAPMLAKVSQTPVSDSTEMLKSAMFGFASLQAALTQASAFSSYS